MIAEAVCQELFHDEHQDGCAEEPVAPGIRLSQAGEIHALVDAADVCANGREILSQGA